MEKEFVVERNSWHYRVNKFTVGQYDGWRFDDWLSREATFCSYFWRTTWSLLATVLLISIILTAAGGLVWLAFTHFAVLLETILIFGAGVLALILIVVGCMVLASIPGWIGNWLNDRLDKAKTEKEPGFIAMKYHSFKNKYCPKLTFKS